MGLINWARLNGLFGDGKKKNYRGPVFTSTQQLEHLQAHFTAEEQNWDELPLPMHNHRETFNELAGRNFESLWTMIDLLAVRVKENPAFFNGKGSNCPEFGWRVFQWYTALIRIAAHFDTRNRSDIGPNCIASRGPQLIGKKKDRRGQINMPGKNCIVARIMCFLQNGMPPEKDYQCSHLCHFAVCGFWEHLR